MMKQAMDQAYRNARRIAIGVLGGTVLLLGLALTVLPGPAFVVIPLGLAILSIEFAWARHMLRRVRRSISERSLDPLVRREDPS